MLAVDPKHVHAHGLLPLTSGRDSSGWHEGIQPELIHRCEQGAKFSMSEGHVDRVVQSWCLRELAFWRAAKLHARTAAPRFHELNQTCKTAFVLEIDDTTVHIRDKPEFFTRAELDDPASNNSIRRIHHYKEFLEQALGAERPGIRTTLILDVNDKPVLRNDVPVFGFQKERESPAVLLPDIDFVKEGLYRGEWFIDPIPYDEKALSAFFVGSTTGGEGVITETRVRKLAIPRIRAAVYFRGHPDVAFYLPNIVHCDSVATEELIKSLGVSGDSLPLHEHYKHKFLISMDGHGATCRRVALTLKSNGVLLKYDSPHLLYYFCGMVPWLHYIPISQDRDIEKIIQIEKDSPGTFRFITKEANIFYQTYLSPPMLLKYASHLLVMYEEICSGRASRQIDADTGGGDQRQFGNPATARTPSLGAASSQMVRYQPISLAELQEHPSIRTGGEPVALGYHCLPACELRVPAPGFGMAGQASAEYLVRHPAAPAWLLRNVAVHGWCGLVTFDGYVVKETLDPDLLHRIPGARRDAVGCVELPHRESAGNVPWAFHLLGFAPDNYATWLLDLLARCNAAAFQVLVSQPGALRTPIALAPPLDLFWKWESLRDLLPDGMAQMAPGAEGSIFVEHLLYVPRLGGAGFLTHPAVAPLFDAVRDRLAGPAEAPSGSGRRIFVDAAGAQTGLPGNQPALAERARHAGFARMVPGELPFWEQVRLFAEASHVIGAHGADLANTVFCRPGTAVCELRPSGAAAWHYRHLAAVRQLRYGCLAGAESSGGVWYIDPYAFDALLQDPSFLWN
jgi:capsular polysaccharide biosynthesis protein